MTVRSAFAGLLCTAVLALVGGVAVFGSGQSAPVVGLAPGSAWFPTLSQGSLALLDGSTGSRMTRVDGISRPGADYAVEQAGAAALVVDRDLGTVTKVDGATWTATPPLHLGSGRDAQLRALTGAGATWVISQATSVVQQLDVRSMTLVGAPEPLPADVADAQVSSDGTLWVVSNAGDVRSFRDGAAATTARLDAPGTYALATVGTRPAVVDLRTGAATVVDPGDGQATGRLCLDVATSAPPVVGGSGGDAPWLLAVAPKAGSLVVSDLDARHCQAIAIGPTSDSPRYGAPVEKGGLVFVPDEVDGTVIVVDPAARGDHVKARIDLNLRATPIALLVHDQYVWFDEVDGDRAGVITDALTALSASKSDAGFGAGEAPPSAASAATGGSRAPDAPGATDSVGPQGGAAPANPGAPAADQTSAVGRGAPGGPADPASGGADGGAGGSALPAPSPTVADLPAPAVGGDGGGGGGAGGGSGGGDTGGGDPTGGDAASRAAEFTAAPATAKVGEAVTFSDRSVGTHTVSRWSAPDGTPAESTNGSSTFSSTFGSPGTFSVTLTISTADGARSVTHAIRVDTQLTVPDLHGLTLDQATQSLAGLGLVIGNETARVDSPLASGSIFDTSPPKGAAVEPGARVDYRATTAQRFAEFPIPPAPDASGYRDMQLGPDGNAWLSVAPTKQLIRVTAEGRVTPFAVAAAPQSMAIGPDGHLWVALDNPGSIARVNVSGDTVNLDVFPMPGSNPHADGITMAPDGNIWASHPGGELVVFTPAGTPIKRIPTLNGGSGAAPGKLHTGRDGLIYVSEELPGRRIVAYDASGTFVGDEFTDDNNGDDDFTIALSGAVVVPGAAALIRLDHPAAPSGPPVDLRSADRPTEPAVTSSGDLWYIDRGSGDVIRTNLAGQTLETSPVNLAGKGASRPIIGPGGMLWFVEADGHVARILI